MIRNCEKISSHLPKRLTISFPIWGLYDTEAGGVYRDLDKMMLEHKERGFNCIRLDDDTEIVHNLHGKLRENVKSDYAFDSCYKDIRQFGSNG